MSARELDIRSLPLFEKAVIEASAGTGKTYSLVRIFVRYLLHGTAIEEILVVTFTIKAAAEMKERIRQFLLDARKDPSLLGEVTDPIPADAAAILDRALTSFDQAAIYTIHGFCQHVLGEMPIESGGYLDMSYAPEEEVVSTVLLDSIRAGLDGYTWQTDALNDYAGMDSALEEGLKYYSNSFGAAEHARHLPDPELIERFTNLLEGALRERLEKQWQLLSAEYQSGSHDLSVLYDCDVFNRNKVNPSRIAKLKSLLHGSYIDAVKFCMAEGGVLAVFEEQSLLALRKAAHKNVGLEDIDSLPLELLHQLESFTAAVAASFDRAWWNKHLFKQALWHRLLSSARSRIELEKKKQGTFDFDDLISRVYRGVKERKLFVEGLQRRYRAALVDEFQDTDYYQWSIFRSIFPDTRQDCGLYVIGDPKQSIYRFRGADVEVYRQACTELDRVYALKYNFRSHESVVDAVNRLFEPVFSRTANSGGIDFEPVSAARRPPVLLDGRGSRSPFILADPPGRAVDGQSRAAQTARYRRGMAAEMADLVANGRWTEIDADHAAAGQSERVRWSDFAVLVSQNTHGEQLRSVLHEAGIPAVFVRDEPLYHTREALHLLYLFAALADPHQRKLVHLAMCTMFYPPGLENAAHDYPRFVQRLHEYRAMIDEGQFARMFFELLSPAEEADGQSEGPADGPAVLQALAAGSQGERRLSNIYHLFEEIQKEQSRKNLDTAGIYAFLNERRFGSIPAELDSERVRLEKLDGVVQIMTVHVSKGLEFNVVFTDFDLDRIRPKNEDYFYFYEDQAADVEAGEPLPVVDFLRLEEHKPLHLRSVWQEDLRLFYVALTRARSRIYMSWPDLHESWSASKRFWHEVFYERMRDAALPVVDDIATCSDKKTVRQIIENIQKLLSDDAALPFSRIKFSAGAPAPAEAESSQTVMPLSFSRPDCFINRHSFVTSYSAEHRRQVEDALELEHRPAEDENGAARDVKEKDTTETSAAGPTAAADSEDDSQFKGARLGDFFHHILEQLDFTLAAGSFESFTGSIRVDEVLTDCARRWFDLRWLKRYRSRIEGLLYQTLRAPLYDGIEVFSLSTIEPARVKSELEFHLPVTSRRTQHSMNGYLKGYVDLVFRQGGKTWLADWKSNDLTRYHLEGFTSDHLEPVVIETGYKNQALWYACGLYAYLKNCRPDFSWQRDFGGICYFFIRYMNEEGEGVWYWKPDEQVITGELARMKTSLVLPPAESLPPGGRW